MNVMSKKQLISLVVPVYHNAASLPDLLAKFQNLALQNPGEDFEFVFVDDGSLDRSFAVLNELAEHETRMRIIKLSRNFGSNAALLAGLGHAHGDAVACIAADLQDPPELIHELLIRWRAGKKVVLAAREGRDDSWATTLLANSFYTLFRRFAVKSMPKQGFDFFLIDRQVCDEINSIQESNAYLMGLMLWLGFDPEVVYYRRRAREQRYGTSMWTLAKKMKYFIDSFVAFSYVPVRMCSVLGFTLSLVGVLYSIGIVLAKLLMGFEAEGWTSLMVVILLVSGVQMIMMGVLVNISGAILMKPGKRPRFVVDRVVEGAAEIEKGVLLHLNHSAPPLCHIAGQNGVIPVTFSSSILQT